MAKIVIGGNYLYPPVTLNSDLTSRCLAITLCLVSIYDCHFVIKTNKLWIIIIPGVWLLHGGGERVLEWRGSCCNDGSSQLLLLLLLLLLFLVGPEFELIDYVFSQNLLENNLNIIFFCKFFSFRYFVACGAILPNSTSYFYVNVQI